MLNVAEIRNIEHSDSPVGSRPRGSGGCNDRRSERQTSGAVAPVSDTHLEVYKGQVLVFRESGARPGPALDEVIGQLRELDMTEVHAQVAAARAQFEADRAAEASEPVQAEAESSS